MKNKVHDCTALTIEIECDDEAEVLAISKALEDPGVLAFVKVHGTLAQLPDDRARARVLTYVADLITDPNRKPPDLLHGKVKS